MASHLSRGLARSWQRRALASLFPLALACNALTGVGDLDYTRGVDGPRPDTDTLANRATPGGAAGTGNAPDMGGNPDAGPTPCSLSTDGRCPPLPPPPPPPILSACTSSSDCSDPYRCLAGVCSKPCETGDDCWSGSSCVGKSSDPFRHCSSNCDLVTPSKPLLGLQECGEGLRCTLLPDSMGGTSHADCAVSGLGTIGSVCDADADCRATLNCFDGRCATACGAGEPTCSNEQRCGGRSMQAGQDVGSCCSVPAGQECNLVTDCGCDAISTCSVVIGTDERRCRVVPPAPLEPYSGCASNEDCPARHSCLGGACKQHCSSFADCGSAGVDCAPATRDGNSIAGFSFCARGCDLVSPQEPGPGLRACGAQATCNFFSSPVAQTDCVGAGTGVQGSSCTRDRDCAAGFDCLARTCERWCDPAGSSCGLGLTCSAVFQAVGRELGRCCQPPAIEACDWATDCGCGAGETCELDAADVRFCRAINSAVPAFAACTTLEQCPAGFTCAGGTCMDRCFDASDCGQAGAVCIALSDEVGAEGVCSRTCDVLAPQAPAAGFESCPGSLSCRITSVGGVGGSFCAAPGATAAGSACTTTSECSAGLVCYESVCRRFCDPAATGCAAGTTCNVEEPAVPSVGGRSLGLCLPG